MAVVWSEINLNAPQMSLAGRGDDAPANRAQAAAALVSFASGWMNERSLNWRIERELAGRAAQAEAFFRSVPPSDRRRLLAEVWVAARNVGGMSGRTYMDLTFHRLTENPIHAIRQARNTPSIGPAPNARSDQRESRWFVGTRR